MRFLLLLVLLSLPVHAQHKRWMVTAGGAVGSIGGGSETALGGILSVSYDTPFGIYSLRHAGMGEVSFASRNALSAYEFGGLYSRAIRGQSSVLTMSVGFSLVMVRQAIEGTEYRHRPTLGVPFEAQLAFPSSELDVGFTFYGNVNPKAIFYGAGVVVRIGG